MELRTLSYYVAVADAGTVIGASHQIRVSQPAVSRQLRQLERELGVDLFDRDKGRLTLSRAGTELLPLARDILAKAAALKGTAQIMSSGRLSSVVIAAPTTTLSDIVSPFVATMTALDPTADIMALDDLQPAEAARRGADLIISASPLGEIFSSRPVARLPVHLYVPPEHRWSDRHDVRLDELAAEDVIAPRRGASARESVEDALRVHGAPPLDVTVEAANGVVAQALAASGRGVAIASDDPAFGLVQVELLDDDRRPVSIVLHGGWPLTHPGSADLADLRLRLATWIQHTYPPRAPMARTVAHRASTPVAKSIGREPAGGWILVEEPDHAHRLQLDADRRLTMTCEDAPRRTEAPTVSAGRDAPPAHRWPPVLEWGPAKHRGIVRTEDDIGGAER